MIVDVIFVALLLLAFFKGYRKGFVIAIFSFVGIFIGVLAAMKFSSVVALWLGSKTGIAAQWLPFLAFLLILILVLILVRMAAKILEGVIEMALLGWLNKIGGFFLYALLYLTLFSIVLFFANKMEWSLKNNFSTSLTYPYIKELGPKAVELIGNVIPFFKGVFVQLSLYFDQVNTSLK